MVNDFFGKLARFTRFFTLLLIAVEIFTAVAVGFVGEKTLSRRVFSPTPLFQPFGFLLK